MKTMILFLLCAISISLGAGAEEYVLQNSGTYTGCEDTTLWINTNWNLGGYDKMYSHAPNYTPLIKFNLDSFSSSTYVETATLSLYMTTNQAGLDGKWEAHKMLVSYVTGTSTTHDPQDGCVCFQYRSWDEDTGTRVLWRDASDTTLAPEAGVSYSVTATAISDTIAGPDIKNIWVEFDVTSIARSWIADSSQNNGLLIKQLVDGKIAYFASADNVDATIRPKLTIVTGSAPVEEEVTSQVKPAIELNWNATMGNEYNIETSYDLTGAWSQQAAGVVGNQNNMTYTESLEDVSAKYYRVKQNTYGSYPATSYVYQQNASYSGCQDVFLWENTDGNTGGKDYMACYRKAERPIQASYIPLVEFDFNDIPTDAYVETATLSLYVKSHNGPDTTTEYYIYPMLKEWYSGTGNNSGWGYPEEGAVNFYDRIYHAWPEVSVRWGESLGGFAGPLQNDDYSMETHAYATKDNSDTGWMEFDVTEIAQAWVADPATNNGVVIFMETVTSPVTILSFASCEFDTEQYRPKLTIEVGPGPEPELVSEWLEMTKEITWTALVGMEYKVYYSNDAGSTWLVLVDSIIADATEMSVFDDPAGEARQYKVVKILH